MASVVAKRRELRLSQRKFAERFGIAWQTYAQWETGKRQPDQTAQVLLKVIVNSPLMVEAVVKEGK